MSQFCNRLPFMVRFDSFNQQSEDIGYCRRHATPVGNHGNTEWVFEESLGGDLHPREKHFYSCPLFMTIKAQAVDGGVVFIPTDRLLCRLKVGGSQRLQRAFRKDNPFIREVAK